MFYNLDHCWNFLCIFIIFFSDREKLYGMLSKIAVLNEVKCQIMPKHKSSNWWKVSFHVLLKFETKAELIVKRYWVWDFCLIFFMTHKKGYFFNAYLFVGNILFCSLTLIHYREIIIIRKFRSLLSVIEHRHKDLFLFISVVIPCILIVELRTKCFQYVLTFEVFSVSH